MLGRVRSAAIALGLIVASIGLLAQAQPIPAPLEGQPPEIPGTAEPGPAIERRAPESPETVERPTRTAAEPLVTSKSADPCAGDAACYQRRELQTQREMAEAAFWMTVATWGQVVVAIVGTIIAIVGTIFLFRSIRLNRDALIADNRAWMETEEIRIRSPLVWGKSEVGDDFARLQVGFKMKNVGKSPAFNVHASIKYYIGSFAPTEGLVRYQQLAAREHTARHELREGETIFPGRHRAPAWEAPVEQDTIRFGPRGNRIDTDMTTLLIVGCVTYSLFFEKEWRQTGFSMQLMRLNEQGGWLPLGPEQKEVPANELKPNALGISIFAN